MLRFVAGRVSGAIRGTILQRTTSVGVQASRNSSHDVEETEEEFDARYEAFFNRPEIDHWEIRKAMGDLAGMDLVPEPKIVIAALKACRRLNDFALAVRFLEVTRLKGGDKINVIWPYMVQEIKPTLQELGIELPSELGYDKPELALIPEYDIH